MNSASRHWLRSVTLCTAALCTAVLIPCLGGDPSVALGSTELGADEPLPTLGPGRGLAIADTERKPLFVIVTPASSLEAVRAWQESLSKTTRKRLRSGFVVIEVVIDEAGQWPIEEPTGPDETPKPWEAARAKSYVEKRLGVLGAGPVLAILDFAGGLIAREDGEFPKDSRIKRALKEAANRSAGLEKSFAKVEKGVEIIGLAIKRKKFPDACRAYLAIRAIAIPLDSPPSLGRSESHDALKSEYDDRVAGAKKLEDKDRLAEAVVAYEKVLAQFPIPEWQAELRSRIGILWRKIYGTPEGGGTGTGGVR